MDGGGGCEKTWQNTYLQILENVSLLLCLGGRRGVEVLFLTDVEISIILHRETQV